MATPAEAAVIAAARRCADPDGEREQRALAEALDALDAQATPGEVPITWGQVVAGDQLQHAVTKAWHEVLENTLRNGQAAVRLRAVAKPISRPAGTEVTVRRSEMGAAVDMFASVIWSGPNGRTE